MKKNLSKNTTINYQIRKKLVKVKNSVVLNIFKSIELLTLYNMDIQLSLERHIYNIKELEVYFYDLIN